MSEKEARIAWMKEEKEKVRLFSHKTRTHFEAEVVQVEISRTRHQEQMAAEKSTATVVLETVNDASEQAVAQASARVMNHIAASFEDDMFSATWPNVSIWHLL